MIGYAAFFVAGRGPLSPRLSNFLSEYGLIKGGGNFLLFKATEPRVDASELYIYNINVRSMHRGKGAGGALVDAVSNLAVSMGCRSVRLQVATHNRAMILYLKKGFVVTGAVRTGWLRRFFSFHCIVTMELRPTPRRLSDGRPRLQRRSPRPRDYGFLSSAACGIAETTSVSSKLLPT
ncbi:putative GNAT family acetyltransferase [Rhizobium petrolearium]|nr:putative GNAT family acetyltransferase [Neorhizobium petrolearium]